MNNKILKLFAEYLEKQDALSKLTENEKLHSFSYSEIHTVVAIGDLEHPNVTAIAERMKMTKGAISKIIKRLAKVDAVREYQLPENRQKIFYSLTEYGKFLYEEHEKRHALWLKRDNVFLAKYNKEQLDFIEQFMTDFNTYLEEQIDELGGKEL